MSHHGPYQANLTLNTRPNLLLLCKWRVLGHSVPILPPFLLEEDVCIWWCNGQMAVKTDFTLQQIRHGPLKLPSIIRASRKTSSSSNRAKLGAIMWGPYKTSRSFFSFLSFLLIFLPSHITRTHSFILCSTLQPLGTTWSENISWLWVRWRTAAWGWTCRSGVQVQVWIYAIRATNFAWTRKDK